MYNCLGSHLRAETQEYQCSTYKSLCILEEKKQTLKFAKLISAPRPLFLSECINFLLKFYIFANSKVNA